MADTAVCGRDATGSRGEGFNHPVVELAGTGDPGSGFAIPAWRADLRQYFFCCPIVIYRILDGALALQASRPTTGSGPSHSASTEAGRFLINRSRRCLLSISQFRWDDTAPRRDAGTSRAAIGKKISARCQTTFSISHVRDYEKRWEFQIPVRCDRFAQSSRRQF